jgi:hypothetical protein
MTTTTTEADHDMAKAKADDGMERWTVHLTAEQSDALRKLKADGVNPAHVIRAGLDRELSARGAKIKGAKHGK